MNIEKTVIDYLNDHNIPASASVPENYESHATVELVSDSDDETNLRHCLLAVQVWEESRLKCCELFEKVKELLRNLTALPGIMGSYINSAYYFPDPEKSRKHRYQIIIELNLNEN